MSKKNIVLSPKEEQEIKDLRKNFNIIPEPNIYDYRASRRVEISRKGALFFLKASIALNLLTLIIICFTVTVFVLKPSPLYYATHPSGSVFGPLPKFK